MESRILNDLLHSTAESLVSALPDPWRLPGRSSPVFESGDQDRLPDLRRRKGRGGAPGSRSPRRRGTPPRPCATLSRGRLAAVLGSGFRRLPNADGGAAQGAGDRPPLRQAVRHVRRARHLPVAVRATGHGEKLTLRWPWRRPCWTKAMTSVSPASGHCCGNPGDVGKPRGTRKRNDPPPGRPRLLILDEVGMQC